MLLRFDFPDATRAELKKCLPAGLAGKNVVRIVADLAELAADLRHVSQARAESDPQARREAREVLDKRLAGIRNALAAFRPHQLADALATLAMVGSQTSQGRHSQPLEAWALPGSGRAG